MPVEMGGFYNLSIIVQAIENFYRIFLVWPYHFFKVDFATPPDAS